MGRKAKISYEQKLSAVNEYLSNQGSQNQISRKYGINQPSFRQWLRKYKTFGCAGLLETHSNTNHSAEVKLGAVLDYLNGKGSQADICIKYRISSRSQLRNWVLKYNSHEEFKSSGLGGNTIMTKGRTTKFEERIEIVKHCIEHNRNYSETAIKYQVSYQQVRSWVVKYGESGVNSLTDRRGKCKSEDQLTELDRLRAQNKLLEARNNRLEMENEVLKKLEEIERRWT
jgi:transposase-like protein